MLYNTENTYCPIEYNGKCCLNDLKRICRHRCVIEVNEKAMERLRKLPEEQQNHIARKYYSGIMVWK